MEMHFPGTEIKITSQLRLQRLCFRINHFLIIYNLQQEFQLNFQKTAELNKNINFFLLIL